MTGKRVLSPVDIGYSPAMILANKRMNKILLSTWCFMFILGIFFPVNWEGVLGVFGEPIRLVSDNIPSIGKLADFSSIPTLVSGFFGICVIAVAIGIFLILFGDPIDERVIYAFTRSGLSKIRIIVVIYIFLIPVGLFSLFFLYWLPISVTPADGYTWASKVIYNMVQSRWTMVIFVPISVLGIGLLIYVLTVFVFGPLSIFFRKILNVR